MTRHFVIFFSPGTFFSETTEKPIDSWDVEKAVEMSVDIRERYGARPYAFCFTTRERGDEDLDSRETKRSGMYFLGGTIRTLEEVHLDNDPREEILLSNICDATVIKRIVTTDSPWRWSQPLRDGDIVLPQETEPSV